MVVYGIFRIAWGSGQIEKTGQITIESGQSASSVWNTIKEDEYTTRVLPWKVYSYRFGAASKIQAGTYQVEVGESIKEVIQRLIKGDTVADELTVTFPEGFTEEQMAERLANRGIGTVKEFTSSTPADFAKDFPFLGLLPAGRTLEGYLFPDTYNVFGDDTPQDVQRRMLATFQAKIPSSVMDDIRAQGRTLDEIIIMASIIEREVIHDEDMAKVADVLWKRNDEDTGLYADATIRYVLNKWDGGLTVQDLAIDSPYNTRKYKGLPPGPISNPGIRAIMAAINPTPTDFYYYLSTPTGETVFAKTNDEHNLNKAKYLR